VQYIPSKSIVKVLIRLFYPTSYSRLKSGLNPAISCAIYIFRINCQGILRVFIKEFISKYTGRQILFKIALRCPSLSFWATCPISILMIGVWPSENSIGNATTLRQLSICLR